MLPLFFFLILGRLCHAGPAEAEAEKENDEHKQNSVRKMKTQKRKKNFSFRSLYISYYIRHSRHEADDNRGRNTTKNL